MAKALLERLGGTAPELLLVLAEQFLSVDRRTERDVPIVAHVEGIYGRGSVRRHERLEAELGEDIDENLALVRVASAQVEWDLDDVLGTVATAYVDEGNAASGLDITVVRDVDGGPADERELSGVLGRVW